MPWTMVRERGYARLDYSPSDLRRAGAVREGAMLRVDVTPEGNEAPPEAFAALARDRALAVLRRAITELHRSPPETLLR